jgi:hypothetical protein
MGNLLAVAIQCQWLFLHISDSKFNQPSPWLRPDKCWTFSAMAGIDVHLFLRKKDKPRQTVIITTQTVKASMKPDMG